MATAKKSMTKANKKDENITSTPNDIEVFDATVEQVGQTDVPPERPVEEVKEKREFNDSDYILCRSVWPGGLTVTCQSGDYYEFAEYGTTCDIKYRDLVSLTRKHSDHIFLPRFIIMDDNFIQEFSQIQRLYSSMYTINDLKEILDLSINQMTEEISKLPDATKDTLRSLVATEIANGHLDSIRKVKALSDIFDSDFNLLSELFTR